MTATGLGMHANEVVKYLTELQEHGAVAAEIQEGRLYYRTRQGLGTEDVMTGRQTEQHD